jgi:hypothetical protein
VNNIKNKFYGILNKVLRRVKKFIKENNLKNRKPIRLQTLVQILDSTNKKAELNNIFPTADNHSNTNLVGLALDIYLLSTS